LIEAEAKASKAAADVRASYRAGAYKIDNIIAGEVAAAKVTDAMRDSYQKSQTAISSDVADSRISDLARTTATIAEDAVNVKVSGNVGLTSSKSPIQPADITGYMGTSSGKLVLFAGAIALIYFLNK
jgi:hypothetical protein